MITGETRLAAVIANPIKHSLSPFIHNLAFQATQENGVYLAFEIQKKDLAQSIQTIRAWDMYGANLSMPFKQEACQYMDDLAQEVKLLGAMNTIVHKDNKLIGYNTDGRGFVKSLADYQQVVENKKVVVLGAGGAALAIITQLALEKSKEIIVFKRRNDTYEDVKLKLQHIADAIGCQITLYPIEETELLKNSLATADILINTTKVGMTPKVEASLIANSTWLPSHLFVADIIYQPQETLLLKQAQEAGCQSMNGIGMLIHQAAESFRLWTGKEMPVSLIQEKIQDNLGGK